MKHTFSKTKSGMTGEADADENNEITACELHSYVQTNVIQQSSGSQTPELQGDADRVLVSSQWLCVGQGCMGKR